jgi:hypothetical protein
MNSQPTTRKNMDVRKCECGGTMINQQHHYLKVSGDKKIRLRCKECGSWRSIYITVSGGLDINKRTTGRPMGALA